MVSSSASGGMSSIGGNAPGVPSKASIGFTFIDTPLAPAPVRQNSLSIPHAINQFTRIFTFIKALIELAYSKILVILTEYSKTNN